MGEVKCYTRTRKDAKKYVTCAKDGKQLRKDKSNLSDKTMTELRAMGKKHKIKNYSKLKRSALIRAIKAKRNK